MRWALLILLSSAAALGQSCKNISLGVNGNLNGFVPFATNDAWTQPINTLPVDAAMTTSFSGFFGAAGLHPDFGTQYGMPYNVVDTTTHGTVPITMTTYPADSDQMVWPLDASSAIESAPAECSTVPSDDHGLVIDRNTCFVYETWITVHCNGQWTAANGNVWDLNGGEQRPYGMTSADAAGLSIFGGLIKYEEAASGQINHAIRFTVTQTKNNANGGLFVAPATHAAGVVWGSPAIIGTRLRLKAGFDISGYSKINQAILTAMKTYGITLADNGGSGFFQGTNDARWNDGDLANLHNVHLSDFEAVNTGATAYDATTAPTGQAPTIYTFAAATPVVAAGTPVLLTYTTANSSYDFIDAIGPVRGGVVTVTPTATTTYTLTSTNHFGRITRQVTVTVGAGGASLPITTPVTSTPDPVVSTPVITTPIVTPPVITVPVVTTPVVSTPTPIVSTPVGSATVTIPGNTQNIVVKLQITTITAAATKPVAATTTTASTTKAATTTTATTTTTTASTARTATSKSTTKTKS